MTALGQQDELDSREYKARILGKQISDLDMKLYLFKIKLDAFEKKLDSSEERARVTLRK